MTPADQFVHDNAPAIYLLGACLFLIYALLLEQAIEAVIWAKGRAARALANWVRR
jgi:hypothetical protein